MYEKKTYNEEGLLEHEFDLVLVNVYFEYILYLYKVLIYVSEPILALKVVRHSCISMHEFS